MPDQPEESAVQQATKAADTLIQKNAGGGGIKQFYKE